MVRRAQVKSMSICTSVFTHLWLPAYGFPRSSRALMLRSVNTRTPSSIDETRKQQAPLLAGKGASNQRPIRIAKLGKRRTCTGGEHDRRKESFFGVIEANLRAIEMVCCDGRFLLYL